MESGGVRLSQLTKRATDLRVETTRALRSAVIASAIVLVLASIALVPRLLLPGTIPAGQPQWSERAEKFWSALSSGDLAGTYFASHPGLTVLWIAGAAQRLTGADTTMEKTISASRAVAVTAAILILLCAETLRRLRAREAPELALPSALALALLLALDPLSILMTGLVGLDGTVSLMMLLSFLLVALALESGSRPHLLAAAGATGLAVATKAPALLLLALPLLARISMPFERRWSWGRTWRFVGLLALASCLALVALLPAFWVHPWETVTGLVRGRDGSGDSLTASDSLLSVWNAEGTQFFLGEVTGRPGILFYPLQLLFRCTPLALLGATLGWLVSSYRKNPVVRHAALFLVFFVVVLSLFGKKSWRYIAPAVVLLDLLGVLGLVELMTALGRRRMRLAWTTAPCLAILIQGAWVLNGRPYYELRLNPLLGGPRVAVRSIQLGWGAGLEQAIAFLQSESERLGRVVTWSGGYGHGGGYQKGQEFEAPGVRWIGIDPGTADADCHVFYLSRVQRWPAKRSATDELWIERGSVARSVRVSGVELARVRCDLGKEERDLG